MPLPNEPVTLTAEQIRQLNEKLVTMRHDVNNQLSLMMAAMEIIRRKPEAAERMWAALGEQPAKLGEAVGQFARELEAILHITRP
jgi:TolA-binding protein